MNNYLANIASPGRQALSFIFLSGLASLPLLSGCSDKASAVAPQKSAHSGPPVPVLAARAEARDVPVELRNIGNVEAYSTVTVRSQITGEITQVHFREGQEVKAGDLLFTIDPRPAEGMLRHAQADLKRDEAQLVSLRLDFERTKKLIESNIATPGDYEKAEAAYHAMEATVLADQSAISNAALNVEFTQIRTKIDGRTGNLLVKEGNIVKAPDDSLVTINQVRPIYVTFSVPEQDLPAIRQRMREATLKVDAELLGDQPKRPQGELVFIDNAVDTGTGRIKLKAAFPNSDDLLWPGQFVQATLTVNVLKGAIVIPSQAIQSSQNGDFVFVVKEDQSVQKRSVTMGIARDGSTVIESGVKAGETVVTDGQLRLAEGSKVSITTASASAAK
jgi:multidrug efflux system membrane fusion protein